MLTLPTHDTLDDIYLSALREADALGEAPDPFGDAIKKGVDQVREDVDRLQRDGAFITNHYREPLNRLICNYLSRVHPTFRTEVTFRWSTEVKVSFSAETLRAITPVLRILTAEGMTITHRPSKDDSSTTKVWRLFPRGVEQPEEWSLRFPQLALVITGSRCQRVQTGTREVPVFEIVCDWGLEEAALPETTTEIEIFP